MNITKAGLDFSDRSGAEQKPGRPEPEQELRQVHAGVYRKHTAEVNGKMHTLREFLRYTADRFGALPAYEWAEGGHVIAKTFADLQADALKTASKLQSCVGEGKKIALIGDMSYAWICAYYGIMISSNVSVPLDTKLRPGEIAERLNFADVSIVFLSERYSALKEAIQGYCSGIREILRLEDWPGPVRDGDPVDMEPNDPDALASLMFTSGTSGDGLKAAMISQRAILADVTGPVPLCVPGDRLLSLLPIHHCFEIFVGQMKYLYLGATVCINDDMKNLIPNLTRFRITIVVAVPALANMLAALIARGLKEHTMEEVRQMLGGHLRRITIGGASASREVIDTLGLAGITVFVGYGLTETAGGCLANCDASIRPREAGAPYVEGMEMRLEDGELCLRGPMVMQGYYKSPELTARVMEDGWFHTGDLAEITDEGYVIIHGRKDNMIKTPSGEKIYPEVWESRLSMIEGVSAAMAANVDGHLTAILFLREDTPEKRASVIRMIDALNAELPGYEKILDVRFREKPFPMTTSMKIKRRDVMRELDASAGKGGASSAENEKQRQILEKVMRVLPGGVSAGIDDNLYAMGLDSLSTISLALLLDCAPETIYACKTIRRLAEHLETGAPCTFMPEAAGKIRDVNRYISVRPEAHAGLGHTVLLTGSSGYLGSHIMAELVRAGYRVICLVRSEENLDRACLYYGFAEERKKVETVISDLEKEWLGLSMDQYGSLCRETETVIHAAALVSHVGSAETSYRINVGGTQNIIRFCAQSCSPLFHISTYAVAGFGTDVPLTEDLLDIGQEITLNPYVQTKYQAEEQVLLARDQGVASTIFRIGNLGPRASDGLFQINAESSGMAAQLRAFRKMGVFPESMRDASYDDTAVDMAARAIVLLAEADGAGYIWHIMNPSVRSIEQLTEAKMISDREFAARLSEGSADRDIAMLSVYYRMAQSGFNQRFDSNRTQSVLEQLGFGWN